MIHQENKGVSAARNLGIDIASGEYVMFVDPDDMLVKNLDLTITYSVLREHNCPIGKGLFTITFIDGNVILEQPFNPETLTKQFILLSSAMELICHTPAKWFGHLGCYIFERSFLSQNRIRFRENIFRGEDILFFIECFLRKSKLIECPFVFYHYIKRHESITENNLNINAFKNTIDYLCCINEYKNINFELGVYIAQMLQLERKRLYNFFLESEPELQKRILSNNTLSKWIIDGV